MPCRDYLSQVRRAREEITGMVAATVAVASGTETDARALMAGGTWFPCLLDPERQVYRALGITRIALGWFDPLGWWSYVSALFRGVGQGRVTNPFQAPGVAILDARAVARWTWRGQTLGDYPPLREALERLRSLSESSGGSS
jgi:hypothetical protein